MEKFLHECVEDAGISLDNPQFRSEDFEVQDRSPTAEQANCPSHVDVDGRQRETIDGNDSHGTDDSTCHRSAGRSTQSRHEANQPARSRSATSSPMPRPRISLSQLRRGNDSLLEAWVACKTPKERKPSRRISSSTVASTRTIFTSDEADAEVEKHPLTAVRVSRVGPATVVTIQSGQATRMEQLEGNRTPGGGADGEVVHADEGMVRVPLNVQGDGAETRDGGTARTPREFFTYRLSSGGFQADPKQVELIHARTELSLSDLPRLITDIPPARQATTSAKGRFSAYRPGRDDAKSATSSRRTSWRLSSLVTPLSRSLTAHSSDSDTERESEPTTPDTEISVPSVLELATLTHKDSLFLPGSSGSAASEIPFLQLPEAPSPSLSRVESEFAGPQLCDVTRADSLFLPSSGDGSTPQTFFTIFGGVDGVELSLLAMTTIAEEAGKSTAVDFEETSQESVEPVVSRAKSVGESVKKSESGGAEGETSRHAEAVRATVWNSQSTRAGRRAESMPMPSSVNLEMARAVVGVRKALNRSGFFGPLPRVMSGDGTAEIATVVPDYIAVSPTRSWFHGDDKWPLSVIRLDGTAAKDALR